MLATARRGRTPVDIALIFPALALFALVGTVPFLWAVATSLKAPVDAFFDGVMVMTEDTRLRENRVALLAQLHGTMNRVADISKLARG